MVAAAESINRNLDLLIEMMHGMTYHESMEKRKSISADPTGMNQSPM